VSVGCHGSIGEGAVFAAAEDFSHLVDDDIASSPGDMIGSGAVSRRDHAGNSSLSDNLILQLSHCCNSV